jgi:hypothetical protein
MAHTFQWIRTVMCPEHIGTGIIVQDGDTPREHAGAISLDGGTKVPEGSTVTLCVNGFVRVLHTDRMTSKQKVIVIFVL